MKINIEIDRPDGDPAEAISAWAIDHLRGKGFAVALPQAKERVSEFCDRLGICNMTLLRRLASPFCPDVHVEKGKRQLIWIQSNPAFDAFCVEGKTRCDK